MKKITIFALFIITFLLPHATFAKSFTTITPYYPPQPPAYRFDNNTYNRYLPPNKNQRFLPPPPNSYNNYNNFGYYDPYYYPKTQSRFKRLKNFFSSGEMTGFTPSYNNSFIQNNNPYGYQSGYYDSNGNYDFKNYDIQNGMSIKILD